MTATVPTEHVLTPDDRCPCGKPQEGSGYCSYECYSKHDLGAPIEPATSPASMGGPLSEAEQALNDAARAIATNMQRWSSDRTAPVDYFACDARELIDVGDAIQLDDEAERLLAQGDFDNGTLLRQIAEAPDSIRQIIAQVSRLGADLFDANARVGVLEGQLAKARALHKPERRYTPDDGETSYATYAEAADASFTGFGTAVSVTFFEVCSHCASIEMAEGCEHDYKESLWPCENAVALGLDGGGSDA